MSRPSADRRSRATCSASSVGWLARTRSVSNTPSPSWKPRSKADRCAPFDGQEAAVDPDAAGRVTAGRVTAGADRHSSSLPPMAPSGPRAFATVSSHSAAGSLFQVIPPPTWRREPAPVGDEGPDQDARLHRAVRPDPAERTRVRAAPDRFEPLEDLHRPDLRSAGDRPARERRGQQVERVAAGRRGRRSPSTRGAGPRPSARGGRGAGRGRCPAGRRGPGRCAGRRRSSRSRRDPWRSSGAPARQRPILGDVAPARPGALDRVRLDLAAPRRPTGTARATPTGAPGDGRSAGSDQGRGRPRTATDRRSAGAGRGPTGRRRTASRGGGSGLPGRCRRGRCARERARPRSCRRGDRRSNGTPGKRPRRPARGSAAMASTDAVAASASKAPSRRRARRSAGHGRRRAGGRAGARRRRGRDRPSQAWPVRRSQATTQSWSARRRSGRSWSAGAIDGRRSSAPPKS